MRHISVVNSLEELIRLLLLLSEKVIDPTGDHSASLLELGSIIFGRRVQLDAVATVVAVRDAGYLVESIVANLLCGPSPWILHTVGEEDVRLSDIPTTLVNCGLFSLWHSGHALTERACAHSSPV